MSVAILLPVLNRPHRVAPLLENIRETTPEPHTVIFAASDYSTLVELERVGARVLIDGGDTYPNRMNRLFHVTTEPYVFLGADDYLFHRGWLTLLLDKMVEVNGVVCPEDLFNPRPTCYLVSRDYINEQSGCVDVRGVVCYPHYHHCFVDSELCETAAHRGRFAIVSESIVEHRHPAAGKGDDDATYQRGMSFWDDDETTFSRRRHMWTTERLWTIEELRRVGGASAPFDVNSGKVLYA